MTRQVNFISAIFARAADRHCELFRYISSALRISISNSGSTVARQPYEQHAFTERSRHSISAAPTTLPNATAISHGLTGFIVMMGVLPGHECTIKLKREPISNYFLSLRARYASRRNRRRFTDSAITP
jgi:hypothetical protein